MRRSLVAANWKMHGSREFIEELLATLTRDLDVVSEEVEIVVCPPSPYLGLSQELLRNSPILLGAQNAHEASDGAFTGEVAAQMLNDFDVAMVIVGHSERRQIFAETDAQIAAKCHAVIAQGMTPILCVGETLQEREAGSAEAIVARQLDAVLDVCSIASMADAVIAYEPVWAIGTGKTATPAQAQEMHGFIRELLSKRDSVIGAGMRILYGGSVNAGNAAQLFAEKDIDGGLVGGASLKSEEFITICKSVSK